MLFEPIRSYLFWGQHGYYNAKMWTPEKLQSHDDHGHNGEADHLQEVIAMDRT